MAIKHDKIYISNCDNQNDDIANKLDAIIKDSKDIIAVDFVRNTYDEKVKYMVVFWQPASTRGMLRR